MPTRRLALHCVIVATAVIAGWANTVHAELAPVAEGEVRFHQVSRASFDSYTDDPTPAEQQWMRDHYDRMQAFTPYFDTRLSWYPDAWVYRSAYAIFPDSQTFMDHPEWVLKDESGNMLFIPYDCESGTCPQFAGDFGNPAFRANWIARAAELIGTGYVGIWIDDVNLSWRISDGNGDDVIPVDPRTGTLMTIDDWQRYFAEFLEEIRVSQPLVEIAHNVLWNTATPANDNIYVDRQVDAADYIYLERGASDRGLVGGSGPYGFETFLGFIDYVHGRDRRVMLVDEAHTLIEREFALAGWFLVSGGADLMGSENLDWVAPDTWWHGYDLDLGAAQGARFEWNGLIRREFDCGLVLVNQPDMPSVSVALGQTLTNLQNEVVNSVTLGPASAAILLKPCVTLANVFDTTVFGSSDPSGLSYHPVNGTLLLSDSEVNETPFFTGFNIFELTPTGGVQGQFSTLGFTAEPSGITYNTVSGTVFIVDDDQQAMFEADISTSTMAVSSSIDLDALGIPDSEGVSFHPATGNLFVLDGADGQASTRSIYEVTPAGSVISMLPIGNLAQDPEGLYFDLVRNSFFVVSMPEQTIFEISTTGELIAGYDIQPIADSFGVITANGVTLGSSSDPNDAPAARNLYFADRGIDKVNDGRIFEISLNHPPVGDNDADAIPDSIDNCTIAANTTQLDADADGIGNRCDADFNNDCIVNFLDLGGFADAFLSAGPGIEADLNGDEVVNFFDLLIMQQLFFAPPGPSASACN